MMALWLSDLACSPSTIWSLEFVSSSHHVGFMDELESGQVFLGKSPVFPYTNLISPISPFSSILFHFILSGLMY